MSEKTKEDPKALPKNRLGGLNLNWAIRQSLDSLGVDAKIADVRDFIHKNYGKPGKDATANDGSLSTALGVMRKKVREEQGKTPPVPAHAPNTVAKSEAKAMAPVVNTDTLPHAPGPLHGFKLHVSGTLAPALKLVGDAEAAAGGRDQLLKAMAVLDQAEKELGGRDKVVALVNACG